MAFDFNSWTDEALYFSSTEGFKVAGTLNMVEGEKVEIEKVEGEKEMNEMKEAIKNKSILEQFKAGECYMHLPGGIYSLVFNYYMYKNDMFSKEDIIYTRPYSIYIDNKNELVIPEINDLTYDFGTLFEDENISVMELAKELFLSNLCTCGIIIHNEQEAKAVCVWLHDNGREWSNGESYLTRTYYKNSTTIMRNDGKFYKGRDMAPSDFYTHKFFTQPEIIELAARYPEETETKAEQEFYHVSDETKENILRAFENCLERYEWKYNERILQKIINHWEKQKQPLFQILSKHPNWVEEKCYIHFDADYTRTLDVDVVRDFIVWVENALYKDADKCEEIHQKTLDLMKPSYQDWATQWLARPVNIIVNFLDGIRGYLTSSKVDKNLEEWMNANFPDMKVKEGQKISRLINKYCTKVGINELDGYNREFAKCADGLNPVLIKRHTVISLNPVDYLMMSNGNSWASCHTIDVNNIEKRANAYDGCYCAGTMSYMLDPSSFVYYTVDGHADNANLEKEPKVLRQMFHYNDYKLLQARLYPQSNDSSISKELKANIRAILQKIFADALGIDNLWKTTTSYDQYIETDPHSLHYRDYNCYTCHMSYPKEMDLDFTEPIYIGAETICIECGSTVYDDDTINCCSGRPHETRQCYECGDYFDEEDLHYCSDGHYYCSDCCRWSEEMGEYIANEDAIAVEDDYVTQEYIDCHPGRIFYCDNCDEYYFTRNTNSYEIEDTDETVCEHCIDEYTYCDRCGCYFYKSLEATDDGWFCDDCYEEYLEEKEAEKEEVEEIEIEVDELVTELKAASNF